MRRDTGSQWSVPRKCWRDVVVPSDASDQSRRGVKDCLYSPIDRVGDPVRDSVAVVDATCDEGMNKSVQASVGTDRRIERSCRSWWKQLRATPSAWLFIGATEKCRTGNWRTKTAGGGKWRTRYWRIVDGRARASSPMYVCNLLSRSCMRVPGSLEQCTDKRVLHLLESFTW